MVLARHLLRRERLPLAGGRIPLLRRIDAVVEVDEPRPGRVPARREQAPVGERGEVVLAAPVGHRCGRGHLRRRAVDVDDPGVGARAGSARDEDLPDVVEGAAAVAAVQRVALAEGLPRPATAGVERAHGLVRARVEGAAVGSHVEPRVQRQVERRGVERAQAARGRADLRHVGAALGDQHLAVAQRGDARIPPAGRHVGAEAPRVRRRVEGVGLDDPVQLCVLVAARQEDRPVRQVREPAAEDVEAGIDVDRRLRPGRRVPHRGAGVVMDRIGLGRVVADGVVGEHLAVREQRDVDADHGPVHDRAPLSDVPLRSGHRRGGDRRVARRRLARVAPEPCLVADRMRRGVLGFVRLALMAERERGRQGDGGAGERDRDGDGGAACAHGATLPPVDGVARVHTGATRADAIRGASPGSRPKG